MSASIQQTMHGIYTAAVMLPLDFICVPEPAVTRATVTVLLNKSSSFACMLASRVVFDFQIESTPNKNHDIYPFLIYFSADRIEIKTKATEQEWRFFVLDFIDLIELSSGDAREREKIKNGV